jgi:3-oxoacyl-[acyl-carrier protein] reductase
MKPLDNKVAIITGASRGISAHIATALARAGAHLAVNYSRNGEAADQIVAGIRSAGGEAVAIRADMSRAAEVRGLFDAAVHRFGKVHILVNNAGILMRMRIENTTDEEFDRIFRINVHGVFYALREAASRLESGGRIVNISSSVTRLMLPTYGAYAATKAAVEQLTRVLAKEVGSRAITVNSISPGPTNTDLFTARKTEEAVKRLAVMAALGRI